MKFYKMAQKLLLIAALSIGLSCFAQKSEAATVFGDFLREHNIEASVSADVTYASKYVWRGFVLDNDQVIQPAVTFSVGGLEGGIWGSWDTENKDGLASDEVDGWIGYNFDLGFISEELEMVGVSIGHTWYDFPEANLYSKEFYIGFSFDTFLSPYVTWYHDYEDEAQGGADGDYLMVGIGHSFDVLPDYGITLDLGLEYGYNHEAFIADTGSYMLYTAGLTVPLSDNVTFTPMIGFSQPFGDIEDAGNDDEFFGGATLSFSM